ncbi:MAG: DUF2393 family protein [Edaphobacter sp.]
MSDVNQTGKAPGGTGEPAMFETKQPAGGGLPVTAWIAAAAVVFIVLFGLILAGRRKAEMKSTSALPLAAYAANLPLSQLQMSESTSFSGGKSTFVDGHIKNTGTATVTGITVQVLFGNLEGTAPDIETMQLTIIRTRQPYIDTQAVSGAPLKPGDERDFRLIFEPIPQNWNMEMPEVRVVKVDTK